MRPEAMDTALDRLRLFARTESSLLYQNIRQFAQPGLRQIGREVPHEPPQDEVFEARDPFMFDRPLGGRCPGGWLFQEAIVDRRTRNWAVT